MFLKSWIEFGGFELNHHWHGVNVLSLLECALLAALLCSVLALFAVRKSKRLTVLSLVGALSFATAAYAANTALSALSASGALAGANLIYVVQTAGVGGVKATMTQVATFINSLFSGDFTCASGGTCTLKNTGPGATGPVGSATVAPVVTIDAQGRVTALTSASITGGAVSSVTGGIGVTVTPTTGAVVVSMPVVVRNTTATTDTITSADKGSLVTESNASSVAVAITTAGFVSTDYFTVKNKGAGLATYTPSSGTIDGNATLTLKQNQSADLYFDGTNYFTLPGRPTNVVCADLTNGGTACPAATGTSGHTLPYLDGANAFSGAQTFGEVLGTIRTVSGTTDTLAATDCGTEVTYSNASAVTVTIPQTLPAGCNIAIAQIGAGKVSVNGSAVTPATLHSAHSYTGTAAQWSIIGINIEVAGTPAIAILTGDGA